MKKLITTILAVITTAACHAAPFGLWINANTTNNYSDSSKWIAIDGSLPGGVPGPSNDAYIFDGTLLVGPGGNFNPQQLIMGWENWHVGEYLQTGGTTRVEFWTTVGKAGNQVFNMNNGSYSTGDLAVGWINPVTSSVGTGVFNLNGGTFSSRAAVFVGLEGATGTVNINGGTLNSTGNEWGSFRIANYGTGSGVLNLGGTGVVNASKYTAVGGWGNGVLNITGGTWNQMAEGITVGDSADNNWTGRGDVNQNAGVVNADYVYLQNGTYNLNGGTLNVNGIADTSNVALGVMNLNGGTLLARINSSDFIQANTVDIKQSGVTVNTADKEIVIDKELQGVGGLIKEGSGTLTFNKTNTYAGTTTINTGTVIVNSNGSLASSNIVVSAGTQFRVNGSAGNINLLGTLTGSGYAGSVILNGGTVSPGNSPGLLTVANLNASNGNFAFEIGAPTTRGVTYDAINATSLLTLGSNTTWNFNVIGNYNFQLNDTYDLFDWGTMDAATLDTNTLLTALPNLNTATTNLKWSVDNFTVDGSVSVIPEPSALTLGILGSLVLIGTRAYNRRNRE